MRVLGSEIGSVHTNMPKNISHDPYRTLGMCVLVETGSRLPTVVGWLICAENTMNDF